MSRRRQRPRARLLSPGGAELVTNITIALAGLLFLLAAAHARHAFETFTGITL